MNLHRFALVTTAVTFLLLLVGGTINPTGSSLACPDWPTCYGTFFPEMTGGVQYEHTHRLVATLVGLMTIVLAVWIWRARPADRLAVRLGFAALALVVLQGVLGGVTVLLKLPLLVSVAHLGLSMIFFMLLVFLSVYLGAPAGARRPGAGVLSRGLVRLSLAAVFFQVLLGALVRHTKSGRVCGQDWLLCDGVLWPAFAPAQLHMLHRAVALIVLGLVVLAAVLALRQAREQGRPLARAAALAAPVLVALQIVLGILTVTSSIGLTQAVAHLGVGALLLGDLLLIYLGLGPLGQPAEGEAEAGPETAAVRPSAGAA